MQISLYLPLLHTRAHGIPDAQVHAVEYKYIYNNTYALIAADGRLERRRRRGRVVAHNK